MSNSNEKRLPDENELHAMASELIAETEGYAAREVARRAGGVAPASSDEDMPGADASAVPADGGADEANVLDGEIQRPHAALDEPVETPARAARVIEQRDPDRPRQIVPGWLRSRSELLDTCRHYVGRAGHTAGFHAVRLPVYALRLVGRSPVGAGRLVATAWRWAADSENVEVRRALMASAATPEAYLRMARDRRAQVRGRGAVLAAGAGAIGTGVVVVASTAPDLVQAGTAVVVVTVLGLLGRKKDARIVDNSAVSAKVPALDQGLIREALSVLGIPALNQVKTDPAALRFVSPIVRDGAGYRADIDLPPGATASQVMEKRSQLASGLRRPIGCVWPEGDPDTHEGRLVLYVADRSLSQSKPAPWPLAKTGRVNLFEPIPVGVDQRGRKVETTLIYASGIVGAIPRMGKTFTLRLLLLAAALDPRVELHVHDLRGGADLAPLGKVAHYYRSGDDPEDINGLLADARAMQKEMMRRYKVIRTTLKGDPRCPEGKVTDELASDRALGLHPILAAYDETQVMFEHPDHGKELRAIFEDLVRRGPAAGIMVWLATQRPDDKSIPVGVSANAVLRFCLKVMGWRENNMVLGDGMYAAGYSATTFSRKDLGVAYMVGEGDDPVIVRTAYIDAPLAETIADRARAARLKAGMLTGMAAGDEPADEDQSTILDHLLAVWPGDEAKVWSDDLADMLAADKPALYEGWAARELNAALKPHGIRPKPLNRRIDGKQNNKPAIVRADLIAELTGDDETRED